MIVGRNDRAIVDALEEMAQANQALQVIKNGWGGEFRELGKFQKNYPPTFKGIYEPECAQTWIQEIEKIFKVMACTNA